METQVIDREPPTGEGLTFEKVWAMFQESSRKFDREMQESRQKWESQFQETERIVKAVSLQMGDLHRSFGELAEHLVAPGIAARFNELGYHFDAVSPGGHRILDAQGKTKTEIDLLLENSEYIMAVEVKSKPKIKDLEHHIKRLEILKENRERKQEKPKKIMGAIAGAVFGAEEKKAAIEAGFYVLEQSGDTMKMDIPDNFVPREW
jgi:predicted AAA+ superfamily ATPase